MDHGADREDDELQFQQGGQLYPIGRSLRSTFPAPDGDELQPRITSLMVELSQQSYDKAAQASATPVDHTPTPSTMSVWQRVVEFIRRGWGAVQLR